VLLAFALGLPAYSAFLVLTRAFYATQDARTPALVNAGTVALSSAIGAALFVLFPEQWSVPGLAVGHSIGFIVGSVVLGRLFARRAGAFGGTKLNAALMRVGIATLISVLVMFVIRVLVPDGDKTRAFLELAAVAGMGALTYLGVHVQLRSPELRRLVAVVRPG
jgi:putative peptidoglycan lipid II flippase